MRDVNVNEGLHLKASELSSDQLPHRDTFPLHYTDHPLAALHCLQGRELFFIRSCFSSEIQCLESRLPNDSDPDSYLCLHTPL